MGSGATSFGSFPEPADGHRVRDVVRDVVAEVASDELVVVQGLTRFDDDAVVRRLARSTRRREPLGFGAGEIAALVTPIVWLIVDEAAKQAVGSAVGGAAKGARALLRRILRRRAAPVTVPALTPEQLGQVRQRVLETAKQRGFEQERATAIADAVVARLALGTPGDDTQPSDDAGSPPDGDRPAAE